jgi:iron(III) transport system substrate-binding protein
MTKWLVLALGLWGSVSQAGTPAKKDLWIYTSVYKEFAAPLADAFQAKHPEYSVQLFQSGSEKIQAKVEAEILANRPQADILLTSDPFWSQDLVKRGLATGRPGHEPAETNYYSVMVLIAGKSVPEAARPRSFADLTDPKFDHLIQAGSPLESGTTFSTVAILSRKYGWDYFEKLARNHLASNGGNSTVIQKVESGEKKIGVVLLENALAARKRGSPIEIIYPGDGVILIPSVQVLIKKSPNPEGAAQFAEFVLSPEGQKFLRAGYMYSVRKDIEAPEGAPPLKAISAKSTPWTPELVQLVGGQSKAIKQKFASIVLE